MYHCATCSVWPGPLLIFLYLALTAKTLDTPDLEIHKIFLTLKLGHKQSHMQFSTDDIEP